MTLDLFSDIARNNIEPNLSCCAALVLPNSWSAVAVRGDGLDKGRVEIFQTDSAVDVDAAPTGGGFDARFKVLFDPAKRRPRRWYSGCTAIGCNPLS